jgi:hypothetical protein
LGRCIRHKADYGAIILLDERLQAPRCTANLSRWVRDNVQLPAHFDSAFNMLTRFFGENAAQRAAELRLQEEAAGKAVQMEVDGDATGEAYETNGVAEVKLEDVKVRLPSLSS